MYKRQTESGDVSGGAPGDAPAPFMPPGGGGGANSMPEAGGAAPGAYRGEKGVLRADAPLAPGARAGGPPQSLGFFGTPRDTSCELRVTRRAAPRGVQGVLW